MMILAQILTFCVRNRIEIVATIDRTGTFGWKKSIESRFEYDLDQILDGGRSNCISLIYTLLFEKFYAFSCFPFSPRLQIFVPKVSTVSV